MTRDTITAWRRLLTDGGERFWGTFALGSVLALLSFGFAVSTLDLPVGMSLTAASLVTLLFSCACMQASDAAVRIGDLDLSALRAIEALGFFAGAFVAGIGGLIA